ncbi:hypothetical protein IWQ60_009042 [Tieghemiomyces parasiticus]|uniref:NDT80 domain-containing protein n=1 Tax=Tieghemiomyces parasiticus TaxID=78921 RepID=A0A9W7ZQK3_9FUNG|nr:hypothetical protein IWQ60_009042 [Tieghemiomyces parasiticus]
MMLHDNKWSSVPSTPAPNGAPTAMAPLASGAPDQFIDTYGYGDPSADPNTPLHSQPIYMNSLAVRNDGMEPPRPASAIGTYGASSRLEGGAIRGSLPVPDHRRYGHESAPYAVPFMGSPYSPAFGGLRKRRTDTVGFSVEAGPYFTSTRQLLTLYSLDHTMKYTPNLHAKIDRGFFQADNDWTCYRRNYFQVSAAFNLATSAGPIMDPDMPCLVEADGRYHNVTQFSVGLSAKVSSSEKKIDLVQHTPKRDKGPQTTPDVRPLRAGGNLSLSSVGSNSAIVTYERIQFKTATANNGKRRAAQQYYVLQVELYAKCDNGQRYKLATTQSANLVVRGRSPGHYADSAAHDRMPPYPFLGHPASFDERYMTVGGPYHAGMATAAAGTAPPGAYPSYSTFPSYQSSPMLMGPGGSNHGNATPGATFPASAYLLSAAAAAAASHGNPADTKSSVVTGGHGGDVFADHNGGQHHQHPLPPMGHEGNNDGAHGSSGLNIQGMGPGSVDPWGRRIMSDSFSHMDGYHTGHGEDGSAAAAAAAGYGSADPHNGAYGYPEEFVYGPGVGGGEPQGHHAADYGYYQ